MGRSREARSSFRTIGSSISASRNLTQSEAGMKEARGSFVADYVTNQQLFEHTFEILISAQWIPSAL